MIIRDIRNNQIYTINSSFKGLEFFKIFLFFFFKLYL